MRKSFILVFALMLGLSALISQAKDDDNQKAKDKKEAKAKKGDDDKAVDNKDIVVAGDRSKNVVFAGKEAGKGKGVRLFILSGQSNMAALDHKLSFVPAIEKAFPDDELIFVKDSQSGQPIRRWTKDWIKPEGWDDSKNRFKIGKNDLYQRLMESVKKTVEGKKLDSVSFIWMQGEADAKGGTAGTYEDSMRKLVKQVRDDMGRQDVTVAIGRISDHLKGDKDWEIVRAAQVKVAEEDPLAGWIDTDECNGTANGLHCDANGYKKMGEAFAAKLTELIKKQKK
ncbi:MAG TPA: acetyl xylan esterase [Lentisphaeria bacterium]|nr:MAG: hypothetical protein A2X48_09965 [Lentisphaerae bacterium GWF2_49_21]HBC88179.1 acetyl xylan esterase [Lentisphaeria bacterium]